MALVENLEKQGSYLFKKRGTLPLFIICVAILIVYNSRANLHSILYTDWFQAYELTCLAISLFGLSLRIVTVGYTPPQTSGRNTDGQIADQLNQTGMYSIVRHPLYLGNFFMWLGLSLMTFNFWFTIIVILIYWIYYERIMFAEEQFLKKKFGSIFLGWASRTPTFIPRLSNWQRPNLNFSFVKVLRQEKNGFTALFLMFFIIDFIRKWGNKEYFFKDEWYWTAGLIIGLLSYVILKILKYKSSLLVDNKRY